MVQLVTWRSLWSQRLVAIGLLGVSCTDSWCHPSWTCTYRCKWCEGDLGVVLQMFGFGCLALENFMMRSDQRQWRDGLVIFWQFFFLKLRSCHLIWGRWYSCFNGWRRFQCIDVDGDLSERGPVEFKCHLELTLCGVVFFPLVGKQNYQGIFP